MGKTMEATIMGLGQERCSEPPFQGEGGACRHWGHLEVLVETCLGFP